MARTQRSPHAVKWAGTVASALLAAVWAFSLWRQPSWQWDSTPHFRAWGVSDCGFGYLHLVEFDAALSPWPWPGRITCLPPAPHDGWFGRFHFQWRQRLPNGWTETRVGVPIWFLLLLTGVPTASLWYRDHRRATRGLCRRCAYSLSGIAPGAPCPECGSKAPDRGSESLALDAPIHSYTEECRGAGKHGGR